MKSLPRAPASHPRSHLRAPHSAGSVFIGVGKLSSIAALASSSVACSFLASGGGNGGWMIIRSCADEKVACE